MMGHTDTQAFVDRVGPVLSRGGFKGALWSPVPGASRYLVSDCGEVVTMQFKRPRKRAEAMAGKYHGIQLMHDDGERRTRYLHRMVLEAFVGPAPDGMEARHLNGDRFDNRLENLAWGTRKENHADKKRHGTSARGERNPQAKLTREDVEEMRSLYAAGGWTFKRLASRFDVTTMTAHRAVRGETWQ
jgi:hypothetical protein